MRWTLVVAGLAAAAIALLLVSPIPTLTVKIDLPPVGPGEPSGPGVTAAVGPAVVWTGLWLAGSVLACAVTVIVCVARNLVRRARAG